MSLINKFPAGAKLLSADLNETVPFTVRYQQQTLETFTSGADKKVTFETAIETNSDVVVSGTGNTDFALQRVGRWGVAVGLRFLGNVGGNERHLFVQTGSVFDVTQRIVGLALPNVGSAPCTLACSTFFKITSAPTTIIVGGFQNSTNSINTDVGFGGTNHIALTWLGPL